MNATDPDVRPIWRATYRGSTDSLDSARGDVGKLLAARGADHESIQRAKLVVGELTSNAVRASPGRRYQLDAELVDDTTLVVAVRNQAQVSSIPPPDQWQPADALASHGRGLAIVEAIADSVAVAELANGMVEVSARIAVVPA